MVDPGRKLSPLIEGRSFVLARNVESSICELLLYLKLFVLHRHVQIDVNSTAARGVETVKALTGRSIVSFEEHMKATVAKRLQSSFNPLIYIYIYIQKKTQFNSFHCAGR